MLLPKGIGRRTVLVVAGVAVAALAASSGILVARLGSARGFPVSGLHEGVNSANLQITPMFVVRRGSVAFAIRPFIPDGRDPVAWCPSRGFFESPATGAKFEEDGSYLAGPASRGLDRFRSRVVKGVLQVAPGDVIQGPPRGPEVPATSLPPCDWSTAQFAPGVAPPASPTPEPGSG
jgi:hypothetical protein